MRRSLMVKLHCLIVFNIIWTAETSELNKSTISNAAVLEEESGTIHCNKSIERELSYLITKRHLEQTDRDNENEDGDKSHADGDTDSVSIEHMEASDKSSSSNASSSVSMLDDNSLNLQNEQNKNPNTTYVDAYLSNVTKEGLLSDSQKIENIGEETPQSNDVIETNKTDSSVRERITVDAVLKRSDIIEKSTILEQTVLEKDEKNKQNKDADGLEQSSSASVAPKMNDSFKLYDLGPIENDSQLLETDSYEEIKTPKVLVKNENPVVDKDETPSNRLNDEQSTNFYSADNEPKQHTESTTYKTNSENENKIENENINLGSPGCDIKTNKVDLNLETNNQQEGQSNESKECKDRSNYVQYKELEGESKTDPNFNFVNEENVNNQDHDKNTKTYIMDDIEKDVETNVKEGKDNDNKENIIIIDEHGTIHSKFGEEKSEANNNNNNSSANQKHDEISDDELNSSDKEFFKDSDSQTDEEYFSTEDDERKQEKTSENDKNFNTNENDIKGEGNRDSHHPKQPEEEQNLKKNTRENESEFRNNEDENKNSNDEKKPDQIHKTTFLENMRNRFNNWYNKIKTTIFPIKMANFYNEIKTKKFLQILYMGKVVTLDNYKNNAKYSFKISDNLSRIWVNPDFEITFLYEKSPALGIWSKNMYNDLSCEEKLHLGVKYQNHTEIFEVIAKICSINVNRLDFYSSINKNAKISSFIDNNMIVDYYENCNQIYGYVFFNNISLVFADTKQDITSEVYFSPKLGYCYRDPINDNLYYLDLKHDLVECLIETSLIEQYKTGEPNKILCVRVFSSINQFYVPSVMSIKEKNDKLEVDLSRIIRNEPNIYTKIGQANSESKIMNHNIKTKNDENKTNKNEEKSSNVKRKQNANRRKDFRNMKGNDNRPKRKTHNDKVSSINKLNNVYEVDTLTFRKNKLNINEKKENLIFDINVEENTLKLQEVTNPSLNTLNAQTKQDDANNNENKIDNIHEKLSDVVIDTSQNSQINAMCNELERLKNLLEENETCIINNLETARTLDEYNSLKDDLTLKFFDDKDKKDINKGKNEFNKDSNIKNDKLVSFPISHPEDTIKKHMVARGKDQNKTGNNDTAKNVGLLNEKNFEDLDPSKSKISKKDNLAATKQSKDLTNDQESSVIKNVKTTFWTRKIKITFVLCVIMILSAVGIGLYFHLNK